VKLSAASNLTLNGMQFITAAGSAGADTIKAGAIDQTLTGGAGADTLIGFSGGLDTFKDTAANLNNDTIQNFVTSDTIDLTNLAFGGATVTAAASGLNTKVTVVSGATKSVFTLAGTWSSSGFHLASDTATGTFLTHT
jgi:Ca2+-binding RTX toxin-like protein